MKYKLLIEQGIIRKDENDKWYRKCPSCLKELCHVSRDKCLYAYNHKWLCLSCSKIGKNNPNYGVPRTKESKEKIRASNIGKHECSEEYRQKLSKSQINSGKNHFINNHGINGFKRKTYTFPNGKIVKVQGHEPFTLNLLLSGSINSNEIKTNHSEKPIINYNWSGSLHRYFPDCYLPSSNTIVETKSPWSWEFQRDRNIAKITGSLDAGYNVRIVIWQTTRKYHALVSDVTYTLKKSS